MYISITSWVGGSFLLLLSQAVITKQSIHIYKIKSCHSIAEILQKLVLNSNQSINQSIIFVIFKIFLTSNQFLVYTNVILIPLNSISFFVKILSTQNTAKVWLVLNLPVISGKVIVYANCLHDEKHVYK